MNPRRHLKPSPRITSAGALFTAYLIGLAGWVAAQDINPSKAEVDALPKDYSPYVERNVRTGGFAENLYWGNTHLHTSVSVDAGMVGNTVGPEEAYRFALGKTVTTSTGKKVRTVRPLEFLVVADHAENLGMPLLLAEVNRELLATEFGRRFYDLIQAGKGYEAYLLWGLEGMGKSTDVIDDPDIARTGWERQIEVAEKYNDPGNFTALIGFEWTYSGTLEDPGNLHRVVIFRDDGDKASQVIPFSSFDSVDPEDLWAFMQNYEDRTGGKYLRFPIMAIYQTAKCSSSPGRTARRSTMSMRGFGCGGSRWSRPP